MFIIDRDMRRRRSGTRESIHADPMLVVIIIIMYLIPSSTFITCDEGFSKQKCIYFCCRNVISYLGNSFIFHYKELSETNEEEL